MEKACDHINHKFLLYLLGRYGFGERWCKWIKHCTATTRFSVLVNGTPVPFLYGSRGLKQGDHLSQILFILVMDALSRMGEEAVDESSLLCFLWDGIGDENKFHLVGWDKVCTPISNGGLVIQKLRTFNRKMMDTSGMRNRGVSSA